MRTTLLCLALAVQLRRQEPEEETEEPEPDPNAEMRQEIYELKRTVSEQSADLAKLARIIGTRQDQLEGKVSNVLGDVKSLRGRGKDATSVCTSLRTCGECVRPRSADGAPLSRHALRVTVMALCMGSASSTSSQTATAFLARRIRRARNALQILSADSAPPTASAQRATSLVLHTALRVRLRPVNRLGFTCMEAGRFARGVR
jgi:hypothetical protein